MQSRISFVCNSTYYTCIPRQRNLYIFLTQAIQSTCQCTTKYSNTWKQTTTIANWEVRWGKLQHTTTCSCIARYVAILSLPLLYVCTFLPTYYMSVLQVTEKLQLTTDFYSYGKSHWPVNLNYTIKNTVGE